MALNVFGTPLNMTYSGTGESGNPYVIESTNHSVNTTGEIIFQTTESGTIFPNLTVDSEIASDVAGLFRNTIPIWQASGQDNFSTSFRVLANDQVKVNYIKDGAGAFGDDNVTGSVYFVPDPPEPLPEVAIVMVTQPVISLSGSVLATQPSVKIVDVNGDIVPGTLISVTVGAVAVTGTAVASGTLTVEPVSGNVVFTDLIITGYGSYYLSFTAAGLTPASSNTITFVQDPGNPNPPIPVKPKRSYIPASVPNSGDMETNEFAINVTDKKGYVRDSNGIVHQIFDGNASGTGSVTSVGLSSTNLTLTISDSPVTTSGTIKIDLPETGVSAKAYTNADITIDVYGRITAASNGAGGVTSIIAGTGVSVDSATGDVTVTNSAPDQTVSLTNGTAISVTGTYPDFTITNSLPDQTVSLTNGTAISVTGTYPDFTIANDAPDQIVSLTGGTDISVTGTYPDFTIDFDGNTSYLPLSGGTMTGSITSFGATYDTEVSSDFFGVQLSADHTQGTMLNFDGLDTYSGSSHMKVTPTGLTFPDATTQTTAYTGGAGVSSVTAGTGISVDKTTGNLTVSSTITQYADSNARASLSSTATGLTYTSATGVFSLTASYAIPTTTSQTNWDSAYAQRLQWNGASTNLVAATGRTSLGATTVGGSMFTLTNPSAITFPRFNADNTVSALDAATFRTAIGAGTSSTTGTVTSVAITVPTGLSVSGTPITSTGTLAVTLTAGYSIPTTTSQGNWDTAYTNRITSLTTTGSSGSATLTTNTLNIPTYTLSGLGGQASSTNLTSVAGLTYVSSSFVKMTAAGTFSLDTTAYGTGSVTSVAALTLGTTGTDLSSTVATGTTTPVITLNVPTASALNRGALSSSDWSNFNTAYTNRILSLTTTGSSGSATLATNTLNVPTYTLAGLGGIKLTDLSSSATGLTYTNTTGAFSLTSGYSIPTTTKQGNWDTAYTSYLQWDGGATSLVAATGRTSLGATTVGSSLFTLTNPSAITFPRFNLDNTVTALDAAGFRTAIGAGTSSTTGTVTSVSALTLGTTGTDVSSTVATGTTTPVITLNIPTASATNRGALSSSDFTNFNTAYTNRITSLTTTGSSGAATLTTNTLNVPNYTLAGLGGIKLADLSSTATGLTYTNTTGVFSATSGYAIPTTASQTNWDSAYTQRLQWDGGSTNLVAATGRTSLGATTVGSNLFTLTNPSAVTFPRFNLDNTVSALDAATFRGAIGSGTVTSVAITVPTGLSVSGTPITSSGTLAVTLTAGYSIPTTTSQGNWDTAYTNRITSLTTTGSSGSATLTTNTLNIPTYTLSGLGGQASSASLTSLAELTYASASFVKMTAANTFSLDTSTYLTANQTITLSGDVTGSGTTAITTTLATVPITKGGTGQTTANAAVNALLPSQTGNSGKYLTTNGTDSSWGTVSSGTSLPSASMQMFAGAITQTVSAGVVTTTAPTGWLLANGDAVSRTTYSALWTSLGTTSSPYGQGDGSTTFNLPDMRSRVGVGVGQGTGLTNRTLGGTVGAETVALSTAELASHNHTATDGGHSHTASSGNQLQNHQHALDRAVWTNNGSNPYTYTGGGSNIALQTPNTGNEFQVHQHSITVNTGYASVSIGNSGSGSAHNNMQPSIGLNYIIKT